MRRAIAVLVMLCFLAACDGMKYRQSLRQNFVVEDGDFYSIGVYAFKLIDPKGEITTIVTPPNLDPRARAVLKKIAKLVPTAPQSPDLLLPEGYFVLETFNIADGEAMLEGQLGPVTKKLTAAGLPDCGRNYSVSFYLVGGDWYSPSYKVRTCDQSRHWTPIDAASPPQ